MSLCPFVRACISAHISLYTNTHLLGASGLRLLLLAGAIGPELQCGVGAAGNQLGVVAAAHRHRPNLYIKKVSTHTQPHKKHALITRFRLYSHVNKRTCERAEHAHHTQKPHNKYASRAHTYKYTHRGYLIRMRLEGVDALGGLDGPQLEQAVGGARQQLHAASHKRHPQHAALVSLKCLP